MAAPKNVEYYVSRINGYSKNTIRLQPVSNKSPFVSGDVIIFRLPTNAIVDLHTLALAWDLTIQNQVATGETVVLPRYSQSFIRRVDVTAGGVQVGLGSLNDYGGLWSLLATNGITPTKTAELAVLDGGQTVTTIPGSGGVSLGVTGAGYGIGGNLVVTGNWAGTSTTDSWRPTPLVPSPLVASGTAFYRQNITGHLGLLGGQYVRFLDTNLLPDVEIRITLASNAVLALAPGTTTTEVTGFGVRNVLCQCETISFGDSAYESMVEARLSTGEPIVVPFINHASFETSTGGSGASTGSTTQFTIATQSLNAVMGSARFYNYDSATTGVLAANSTQVPYYSFDGQALPRLYMLPTGPTNAIGTDLASIATTRYQMTIDSKVFPQFLADVGDAYQLTKNMFDGSGNNKLFGGICNSLYEWSHAGFMLGVSLDHNSEDALKDRLVSGLNTNGSNIPITWQIQGVDTALSGAQGFRPIVFCEMTSTLMIYPGRVISVIN